MKTLTPQADQVDKVVDGLANAMADAKEIEDILKNAGDDLAIVAGAELRLDDDELEKELEALAREKEAEAKNGVKEKPKEEEKPDRPAQEEENEPRREEEQSQREREAELA